MDYRQDFKKKSTLKI